MRLIWEAEYGTGDYPRMPHGHAPEQSYFCMLRTVLHQMVRLIRKAVFALVPATLFSCTTMIAPTPTGSEEHADGKDIYILMGQSNMVGRGEKKDLPTNFSDHEGVIQYYWNGVLGPSTDFLKQGDGSTPFPTSPQEYRQGPGLSFANAMISSAPNRKIILIPCAVGGTSIVEWLPNVFNRHDTETLFGVCLTNALAATKHGQIRGILFHQGERDAKDDIRSAYWQRVFTTVIVAMREELGSNSLPLVYAQLGAVSSKHRAARPHLDILKAEQRNVLIPYADIVYTDDLPIKADGLHLSTNGQLSLGERFAISMRRLQRK